MIVHISEINTNYNKIFKNNKLSKITDLSREIHRANFGTKEIKNILRNNSIMTKKERHLRTANFKYKF